MPKQNYFMIRQISLFLILGLLGLDSSIFSQNLYDEGNTLKFADFLYKTQQYDYATQEYERLIFMDNSSSDFKLQLIRCYRLNNKLSLAETRFIDLYRDSLCFLNKRQSKEFFAILFLKNDLLQAQNYLNCNLRLDNDSRLYFQTSIFLLGREWEKANQIIQQDDKLKVQFGPLANNTLNLKHKSPLISASLSTIVPGLGKVYSGYWKDGIIAFVFVMANSFQAYRSFSRYGTHQTFGWVFGGLALGFYSGNIYGSVKAARKFNSQVDEKANSNVKNIVFSGLD